MQAELDSDVALSAANALLSHLRRHPEAASRSPKELAGEFALDEGFVANVLENVRVTRRAEAPRAQPRRRSPFAIVGRALAGFWLGLTSRPVLFVAVTFVLAFVAAFAIVALMSGESGTSGAKVSFGSKESNSSFTGKLIEGLLVVAVIFGTFFLHLAVYFRYRSSRYALYGGLILWGLTSLLMGVLTLMRPESVSGAPPLVGWVFATMGLLMLGLMYAGVGALAAVLGGWFHIRKLERNEEQMSRQDLLERYFELQSRLRTSVYPRSAEVGPPFFHSPIVAIYRDRPFLFNLGIGFAISVLSLVGTILAGIDPRGGRNPEISFWVFPLMLLGIASFLIYILQGYLAKTVWRALLGAICIEAGGWITRFLPIVLNRLGLNVPGDYSRVVGDTPLLAVAELADVVLMIAVSCAGYLGAKVQNRALREINLQRNDQATLLAEMVRIQWKLSSDASSVCVMVVDAARSSEMKAAADPLLVEYTFREYQEWIERISAKHNGRVHATAGDGAVVAFASCEDALDAARELQTDLFRFNKDENRLSHPFRLRIGLHSGEVVGNINEVQFTEVIDIAAHIEGASPVGGITVSAAVSARLPDEQFIDLNKVVDGQAVLMVSNPAEYR